MQMEKKKSMLEEFREIYTNPDGVDTAEMAEESLNRFKKRILKK